MGESERGGRPGAEEFKGVCDGLPMLLLAELSLDEALRTCWWLLSFLVCSLFCLILRKSSESSFPSLAL